MYCNKCGNQIPEGSAFCNVCGNQLTNNNIAYQSTINQSEIQSSNQMVQNQNKKGNNAVAIIVVVIAAIIALGTIGYEILTKDNDIEFKGNESEETETAELKLNDLKITYDSSIWQENTKLEDEQRKVIINNNLAISLTYTNSKYYSTTDKFAESMKDYISKENYTLVEDLEAITINDLIWQKLVYKDDKGTYVYQLLFTDKYDSYSFSYQAGNEESFKSGLEKAKKVSETLIIDDTKKIESEKNAKSQLIGEWDWGKRGYLVIEEEKIYLYQDSSKSMDNVYYGTYKADDKIATYSNGYTEGLYVLITVEEFYMDGVKSENISQIELGFVPNEDGSYTIRNLNTYVSGEATKVK